MLRFGKVEVTCGFLLLMAWLNYCDTQGLLPLGVCAAVMHELGHWLAIRLAGGRVSGLRLSAVGAQMHVVGVLSYGRELLCVLSGPAVNLVLGYWSARNGWLVFSGMNTALGLLNLLPVSRLDGGRAITCIVSLFGTPDSARIVRRCVDCIVALILIAVGLLAASAGGGITPVVVGGWLLCDFDGT